MPTPTPQNRTAGDSRHLTSGTSVATHIGSPAAACSSPADSATGGSWTNRASLVSRRIHRTPARASDRLLSIWSGTAGSRDRRRWRRRGGCPTWCAHHPIAGESVGISERRNLRRPGGLGQSTYAESTLDPSQLTRRRGRAYGGIRGLRPSLRRSAPAADGSAAPGTGSTRRSSPPDRGRRGDAA